MSIFTAGLKLLDEEANAFALLPAVNYGYIYWKSSNPSVFQAFLSISAIVICAASFNILTYGNFEYYNSGDETIKVRSAILLIMISILWISYLGYSLVQIYSRFSLGFWSVLLIGVSLLFCCLLITHGILSKFVPMYGLK